MRFSGEESRNHIEFTHCHLFGAQSSISFGPEKGVPLFGASSVLEVSRELLPALPVVIKMSTRITEKTTVGSLIDGAVAGNVLRKGKVLIPDGSPVRGRVRRLEWNEDKGGYFVVGLEFTEVDAAGYALPFLRRHGEYGRAARAPPDAKDASAGGEIPPGRYRLCLRRELYLYDVPGVGSFFVQGRTLDIPSGFRMTWKTRALVP